MPDRSQFIGRLAGITQLIFAVLIGVVASIRGEPGFLPRGIVLLILFSLPGVVGLIGVAARRPALLIAAGMTSAVGSIIAFSGVTLIFLVPAVLFLYGAVRLARAAPRDGREGWAGVLVQTVIAAAIVVLLVVSGATVLSNTDSACWNEYLTPTGVRIEMLPFSTGGMEVPEGATSSSCASGLISARGVGLAGLFAGAALGLTGIASRRRRRESRRSVDDSVET